MRALVVVCHPNRDGFTHACAQAAVAGLQRAGHEVEVLDLYEVGFAPAMSASEHLAYHTDEPILDPLVASSAEMVKRAEILVFVYETWWGSLPAMLKGWLEKTMVPGVAFVFDEQQRVRPGLRGVRHIIGISSYEPTRPAIAFINDNGRRILHRALRLNTGWRTKRTWLALYRAGASTAEQQAAFVAAVEQRLAAV